MKKSMQRRMLTIGAISLTAIIGLAGCGISPEASGGATPPATDSPVTISLGWWGSDPRAKATEEAVDLFEKEYPNITVETSYSDFSGYWDRLATQTAGGDAPDVSQMDMSYLSSYASRGTLADLGALDSILDTTGLPETVLDSGLVDGKLYAAPIGAAANGVVINTSILTQYGIEIPDTNTWTWDDFDKIALELNEKSGGAVHGITPFQSDSFGLQIYARQHGEELWDDKGKITISPKTVAEFFQTELDWIESGAAAPASQVSDNTGATITESDIVTGKTAMFFTAAGAFNGIQLAAPDNDYIVGNWPTDADTEPGFQYLKPTMYWSISAKTEHPSESALLLNFLLNDKEVAKLFGTERGAPANPELQKTIEPTLTPEGVQALDFARLMADEAGPAPAITPNGASSVAAILTRYNDEVLFGQTTPKDAATAFISELQASIDAAG
jgi:multiple sugar transport system substrate-binding protein